MRNLEEFNGVFYGQDIYIIGAGPSINLINLSLLKNKITIAVNSGYVAHESTFFISDDWSVANWSYFYDDLKNSKKTIALLYEDKLSSSAKLFEDRSVLFKHQNKTYMPDTYSHTNSKYHLGKTRTSLGSAIMVAHVIGAKRILLLGADCCRFNRNRYFWQSENYKGKKPTRNDGVPVDRYTQTSNGITDYDLVDIQKSWKDFAIEINKKCTILNASPISTLKYFTNTTELLN